MLLLWSCELLEGWRDEMPVLGNLCNHFHLIPYTHAHWIFQQFPRKDENHPSGRETEKPSSLASFSHFEGGKKSDENEKREQVMENGFSSHSCTMECHGAGGFQLEGWMGWEVEVENVYDGLSSISTILDCRSIKCFSMEEKSFPNDMENVIYVN
jgi:hypothetical protein